MTWNSIGIESKFQRLLLDYCDGSLEFGDGGGDGIGEGDGDGDDDGGCLIHDWGFDIALRDRNVDGSGIGDGFYFFYGNTGGGGESTQ